MLLPPDDPQTSLGEWKPFSVLFSALRDAFYIGIHQPYLRYSGSPWLAATAALWLEGRDRSPIVYITSEEVDDAEQLGLSLRYRTAVPPDVFKDEEHYWIYTEGELPSILPAPR